MRIGFLWFTCLADEAFLRLSMESVRSTMRSTGHAVFPCFIVDAAEVDVFREIPWVVESGAKIVSTDFPRAGGGNGLHTCTGMLTLFRGLARNEEGDLDLIVKLDSDVICFGAHWLEQIGSKDFYGAANRIKDPEDGPPGVKVNYAFASGGAYIVTRDGLEKVLGDRPPSEIRKMLYEHNTWHCGGYLARYWPEDEAITSLIHATLGDAGVTFKRPAGFNSYAFFTRWPYAIHGMGLPNALHTELHRQLADFVEVRHYDQMPAELTNRAAKSAHAFAVMKAFAAHLDGISLKELLAEPGPALTSPAPLPYGGVNPDVLFRQLGQAIREAEARGATQAELAN